MALTCYEISVRSTTHCMCKTRRNLISLLGKMLCQYLGQELHLWCLSHGRSRNYKSWTINFYG